MAKGSFFKNKEKRLRVVHILAGVVILIHAFEKYESGHGNPLFFAISGTVFLAIAIFHHPIQKRYPWVDGVFFFIEGILSLAVAYDFFHLGKKALPWTYLLLAFFQFFMAFFKSAKGIKQSRSKLAEHPTAEPTTSQEIEPAADNNITTNTIQP